MGAQAGSLPQAPYADLAAATVLRAALPSDWTVATTWGAGYADNLPYLVVWATGVGAIQDPRGRFTASVDIDSFSSVDKATAIAQCWAAIRALEQAAFNGDGGSSAGRVAGVTLTLSPRVIPGTTPATIIRAQATVSLALRPAIAQGD